MVRRSPLNAVDKEMRSYGRFRVRQTPNATPLGALFPIGDYVQLRMLLSAMDVAQPDKTKASASVAIVRRRMLTAFDSFLSVLIDAEGKAMNLHLQESGWTPERAAQGAQAHVERIKAVMAIERARLEAEAVARLN
jgi:hypothetical protein